MAPIQLAYKVLSGNATVEEINTLRQWIALSEENRIEFEDIKLLWTGNGPENADPDPEMDEGVQMLKQQMRRWRHRRKKIQLAKYVLITLVALLLICWFAYHKGAKGRPEMYSIHGKISVS